MRSKETFRSAERGFSLMELLMVMVITPMIFFTVYSSFSMGTRLWTRLVRPSPEEDLSIFYVKLARDLRGTRRYDAIAFEGSKEEIVFPAVIEAPAALGGDRGIGSIRLFYDANRRRVMREIRNISQIHKESEGDVSVLLQNVESFELSYFTSEPLEEDLFWTPEWRPEPKKLPLAVRLKFTLEGMDWPQEKTIFIPAGGLVK